LREDVWESRTEGSRRTIPQDLEKTRRTSGQQKALSKEECGWKAWGTRRRDREMKKCRAAGLEMRTGQKTVGRKGKHSDWVIPGFVMKGESFCYQSTEERLPRSAVGKELTRKC